MKPSWFLVLPLAVALTWYSRKVHCSNQGGTLGELMNYMSNYGYLDKVKPGENRLRTSDEIRKAIADLQDFLNIPITGELDERTKKIIRQKRCGVPDVERNDDKRRRKKRYTFFPGQPAWAHKSLTWRLNRNSRSVRRDDAIRDLDNALRLWSDASSLTFRRVEDQSAKVDIIFSFEVGQHGDSYGFDGAGNTLAHAFPPSKSEDIGGDVHLDEDEIWERHSLIDQKKDSVSVFMVAAHELGHSLGLSHSTEKSALMYPLYQGSLDLSGGLPQDDVYGLQILYGTSTAKQPDTRRPEYPNPERPVYPNPERPVYPNPERPVYPNPGRPTHPTPGRPVTVKPVDRRTRPSPHWPRPPSRRPRVEPTQPTTTDETTLTPVYPCRTAYDAVATVRGELFIFKGKKYWRMSPQREEAPTGPHDIDKFWVGLPSDQDHVDAVYERPQKGGFNVVFFIGDHYWMFDGTTPLRGHPRPLTHLGLPHNVKITAAFVWAQDSNTYFFSDNGYWRFNESLGRVDHKHPKPLSEWPGLPDKVDAAVQWNDGAYFFKELLFWELGPEGTVSNQKLSALKWMKCSLSQIKAAGSGNRHVPCVLSLVIVIFVSFLLLS